MGLIIRWVYTVFVILRDGKLGGGWYLISPWRHSKKNSKKYFCIIKEKIAYIECAIQSSMFYRFYLFLSILLCNVDSALVSDSNAYIGISNCIQIFEFMFECWRNVFSVNTPGKWRLQVMLARKHHSFTKS